MEFNEALGSPQSHKPTPAWRPLVQGPRFTTEWSVLAAAPKDPWLLGTFEYSAAPDDTLWLAGRWQRSNTGLRYYDASRREWVLVLQQDTRSVSPISATEVWTVLGNQETDSWRLARVTASGVQIEVPQFPAGAIPDQVSAAPDGTVWARSNRGGLFAFLESERAWRPIEIGKYEINHISVGSAHNICACATRDGKPVVLQQDSGGGWVTLRDWKGSADWVGACSDGSIWLLSSGVFFLRPNRGVWVLAPVPPIGSYMSLCAAGSSHRVFTSVRELGALASCRVGIVDQPAAPWPGDEPKEVAAYLAISTELGIRDKGGIRARYTNTIEAFGDWYAKLLVMDCPSGIDAPSFEIMRRQLETELDYVQISYNLFENLELLRLAIGTLNATTLPAVAATVELTSSTVDKDKVVNAALDAMLNVALGALIANVPGAAGRVVSLIYAGIAAGVQAAQGDRPPDDAVKVKYGELARLMANVFLETQQANARFQTAILQDWGRLRAVGEAVSAGLWEWPTTESTEIAKHAKTAFEMFFYATLMPVKWKIVHVEKWIVSYSPKPPFFPDIHKIPGEVRIDKCQGKGEFKLCEVWFCNDLGASSNIHQDLGPFPRPELMNAIRDVGMSKERLVKENAWSLKWIEGDIGPPGA